MGMDGYRHSDEVTRTSVYYLCFSLVTRTSVYYVSHHCDKVPHGSHSRRWRRHPQCVGGVMVGKSSSGNVFLHFSHLSAEKTENAAYRRVR